ncbi:MAG: hypothetical protein JWN80_1404 [Microbacteriaceae bacterium]|jgi:hypothetical protein|nr:hypothetical protein [Microbacteriaceae bacterium]
MKLYSDFPARRTRQVFADLIALGSIALFVWLGVSLYQLVDRLAAFGVDLENAGAGFRKTMSDVGKNLGGVPFIGSGIRAPFDGASNAGKALETAGQNQQDAVGQLATALGFGVALVPILFVLLIWLVPRIRFIRRASSAKRSVRGGAGVELLALRALATQRLSSIAKVDPDPMGAWRRGDQKVMRELAALELRASGVKLRPQIQ